MITKIYLIGWLVATVFNLFLIKRKHKQVTVAYFITSVLMGALSWLLVFGLIVGILINLAIETQWLDKKVF